LSAARAMPARAATISVAFAIEFIGVSSMSIL
jgi:hypothetical protein